MVRFGVPGQNDNTLAYVDKRLSTVPAIQSPRAPTVNDKKFPLWCEWRIDKNATLPDLEGEFWKLIKFESNGDATWVKIDSNGGASGVEGLKDQVGAQVGPDVAGDIDIHGNVVNNSSNPSSIPLETVANPGANTLDLNVQVSATVTGAPGDKNDAGICSFDDTAFVVDGDGYVTLAGGAGPAVDSINVDLNTGPGTDPVIPNASGEVAIFGNTVTNATNANSPVATHSRAANQFHVDVQLGAAVAATPADPYDAGLISADNQFFTIDANGYMSITDVLLQQPIGTTYNLGINYSSPTFKVTSSDGTALSATNPGFIVLASKASPGYKIVHKMTADISFEDDSGTSDLTGNTWGTTITQAWNLDMPFYLYGVADDNGDNVTVMISRIPHKASAPAVGNIAKSGSAVATTQGSFFAIDSGVTVGDYDTNPCTSLGSFKMTKNDGPNDDWTVTAIDNRDGFGNWNEDSNFLFPNLQNGATSNNFSSSVGGDTIPTFQNTGKAYTINRGGKVLYSWNCGNITVSGVGAGNLRMHLPLNKLFSLNFANSQGTVSWLNNGASTYDTALGRSASNETYFEFVRSGTGTALVTPGDWSTDKKNCGFTVQFDTSTE